MSASKDQHLRETGGIRIGESRAAYLARMKKIDELRKKIADGKGTNATVNQLAILLGTGQED